MNLQITEEMRVLELGGGNCPMIRPSCAGGSKNHLNIDTRIWQTPEGVRTVDFDCDFHKPLPVGSNEFDVVLSKFAFEHVAYPCFKRLLAETYRCLKPGGKAMIIVPNTEKQLIWIQEHPDGWDGKNLFISASEKLYGDQSHGERQGDANYSADSHKVYLSPSIAFQLFGEAGFENITVSPFGERATDMTVECQKPIQASTKNPTEPLDRAGEAAAVDRTKGAILPQAATSAPAPPLPRLTEFESPSGRASVFDKAYFDRGKWGGGFAGGGYRDFPCHEVTARHVLARQPKSVLELGCARGYVLKRIQDAGVPARGLDISRHCLLTRVCDGIDLQDVCEPKWKIDGSEDHRVDLCFSISFWEHVPEELVPRVAEEMRRVCKRGLHGIDLSENASCKDRTKCTLKSRKWWREQLGEGHEILPKDELERGQLPESVLKGDGKVKLNLGSFSTMFHHGWVNIDALDQTKFAEAERYNFKRIDVREGLPWLTGTVDLIYLHHAFEHFNNEECLTLAREMRRVIKPDGGLRIVVPDAGYLNRCYAEGSLGQFDECNGGCAAAATQGGKFWQLLGEGHRTAFDAETLIALLGEAGWDAWQSSFRKSEFKQVEAETLSMPYGDPGYSLFVDARPKLG